MDTETRKQVRRAIKQQTGRIPQEAVPLKHHTSFGIGGPASLFVEVDSAEGLSRSLAAVDNLPSERLILGGGTNLLISDDGFDGLVLKLNMNLVVIDEDAGLVRAGAGVPTARLVDTLTEAGLGGLEFAAGLPGTIGGGVAGNAGCFGQALSDFLVRATVVEASGEIHQVTGADWFQFAYRHSKLLAAGRVLTEACFGIEPGDRSSLMAEAQQYKDVRAEKHPSRAIKTAGSYFKNLPPKAEGEKRQAAGALLDQVGAKEISVGDAAVFEKHANIIVNRGNATAKDVLTLAAKLKKRVLDRFSIALEEEVRFVGRRPDGL
jgi:UDP-N-acetylmuramate dehydrogenase